MAITNTNIGTGSSTSAAQITIAVPSTIPANSFIIVAVCDAGTSNTHTPTDTQANTYTGQSNTFNSTTGTANGFTTYFTSFTSHQLTTSDSISYTPTGSGGAAVTAFYLSNFNTITTLQTSSKATARGSSTAPSVTAAAAATYTGTLTLGIVGVAGPTADTFTQDSTNATYVTPPVRVGTTGTTTITGGTVVRTGAAVSALSYAPTLGTSRAWGALIVVINPAIILTGVAATGAVGVVLGQAPLILTGVAATGAVGVVTGQSPLILTGVAATGAVTALTPEIDNSLVGVAATGAVNAPTIEVDDSSAIVGVAATGAVKAPTIEVDESSAIIGVAATGAVTALRPEIDKSLVGVAASGAVTAPTIEVDDSSAIVGVAATGAVKAPTREIDVTTLGVAATGAVALITGGSAGAITGVAASGAVKALTIEVDASPVIVGVAATGAAGLVAPSSSGAGVMTGVAATSAVSAATPQIGAISHAPPITNTNIGIGANQTGAQISIAVPGSILVGSVILVAVCDAGTANTNLPSDTQGNTYATLSSTFNNNVGTASGFTALYYSVATTQLTTSDAIHYTPTSGASAAAAVSAFYLSGVSPSTPFQAASIRATRGIGTSPTATAAAVATNTGTLFLGILGINGPPTDIFNQDSTHAAYVTPPVRVGIGGAAPNVTIAGGSVARTGSDVSALAYEPGISSEPWGEIVVTFNPPSITAGVTASGAVAAMTPASGLPLSGVTAIGAVGQVTGTSVVVGVTAIGAVTAPTVTSDCSILISGVAGTGAVEATSEIDAALVGVAGTGVVGDVTSANHAVQLTGVAAIGAVTAVTPQPAGQRLTGVIAIGAVTAPTARGIVTGPADGDAPISSTVKGHPSVDRVQPEEEGDQWSRYLAWRDREWRKRQAQKGILVTEPNIVPDVLPVAPEPATPKLKPVPVRVPDRVVEQWQQQMASAHPLVPAAPVAPFAVAPPAPGLPLPQLSSQLELLRRQMKIKI